MPPFTLFSRRAISPATIFRTGADTWAGNRNESGVRVDFDSALTSSGVWAAMRLLAGDISTFPLDAYRRRPTGREPLRPKPEWIEEPDPLDPSVTRIDHFTQVAISLLGDGNSFTLCEPDVFNPVTLTVLNPLLVRVSKPGRIPEYQILDRMGRPASDVMTPLNIIHTPFFRPPGALRGMSPIDTNSGSIGISIAARKYVERFFGQGAQVPGFIVLPVEADKAQVDQVAADVAKKHGGWRKSSLIGALGGGARYEKTGISPADADLSSIFNQQLEEAARVFGVPPFMIGSQEPAGVAYASSVERAQHYIDHCLRHYTEPIELAYRRLVPGGLDTYLKFNYDALLRGDTKSRFEAHQIALSSKFVKINEIRRLEDLPPFEEAEGGFLETPNNNGPRTAGVTPQ